jgi:ABC-type nickel/cobalt efflux system permease component RcnA
MAELLNVSQRTVYRNMSKELKQEKQKLNEKL